jgi:hypothetical protein
VFLTSIRTAGLALAGAALIVTSFISTAAAAPAEGQPSPADAETVAATSNINIPRADGSILLTKIDLSGKPKYTFTVANAGPERAAFKVKVEAAYRGCNTCDIEVDRVEETVTLNANTSKEYQVECKGANVSLCESAFGQVNVVGVDPYPSNNMHYVSH